MTNQRPLSPHLQVYKLPLTGIISITHRITGIALSLGLIAIVILLIALANGEGAYLAVQAILQFWPVQLLYWGFIYALFFHLCHGIRHLIWDGGKSFDKDTLTRYALYELAASMVLMLTYLVLL